MIFVPKKMKLCTQKRDLYVKSYDFDTKTHFLHKQHDFDAKSMCLH